MKKLIRKGLFGISVIAPPNEKTRNKLGEWVLKGLGVVGKFMTSPITLSIPTTATTAATTYQTKELIDRKRLTDLQSEELLGKAMTWISPLNYGAALYNGHGLNAHKGEQEVAKWSPFWQAVGRGTELYAGPKIVKGVKKTPAIIDEGLTRIGNTSAKGRIVAREMNKVVNKGVLTLEQLQPKVRTRYGDVEIDNPQLAYRQGNKSIVDDFFDSEEVRVPEEDYAPERLVTTKKGFTFDFGSKTFDNPMFAQGYLWYGLPKKAGSGLLTTAESLGIATKESHLVKNVSNGTFDLRYSDVGKSGRRVQLYDGQLSPLNTNAYTWEPGYGYRKATQEPPTSLKFFEIADIVNGTNQNMKLEYKKQGGKMNVIDFLKNGSGIHIKKKNRGKFTAYCGGNVTSACIAKAKASGNPTLVKRATFAANARKWKHQEGGVITNGAAKLLAKGWYDNTIGGFINIGKAISTGISNSSKDGIFGGGNFNGSGTTMRWTPAYKPNNKYNFNAAFDEARNTGAETFMFGDKEYSTVKEANPIREFNNRFVGAGRTEEMIRKRGIYGKDYGPLTGTYSYLPRVLYARGGRFLNGGRLYNTKPLPEIIVNGYAPIRLTTYYPFVSKYPYTGHSELEIPIDRKTWDDYIGEEPNSDRISPYMAISKMSSAKDYNLVTNNCANATLNYLNKAFSTSESPVLFTTPGDVRDYAINKLHGKVINNNNGSDTVLIPRNKNNAKKLSTTALDMFNEDMNGTAHVYYKGRFKKLKGGRLCLIKRN